MCVCVRACACVCMCARVNSSHLGLFAFACGCVCGRACMCVCARAGVNSSHLCLLAFAVGGGTARAPRKKPQTPHSTPTSRAAAVSLTRTCRPPLPDAAREQSSEEDGPEQPMLRVWLQGKLGAFVEPFKEGDEVGGRESR